LKKLIAGTFLLAGSVFAQQAADSAYTAAIREFTTSPQFVTELVDHLPASDTIPSPLKFHGYIAGAANRLTYAEDVYKYMRALAAATPRVRVFSIGKTEEGREMIAVAISDEANLAALDRYKEITRRLSDPRKLNDTEARALIAEGKPIYYATGAMHSVETGSPEMLMELAYRLAVEETPFIRDIRQNVITLFTPVLEVDGRNRMVDLWRYREANPTVPTPPLIYWGHYVAHDNNRDNIGLTLNLSKNVMNTYFEFHPQVVHDLHESVPFIYISTGTGPYNPALDPLMIDEWHRMAYNEVNELTRRGIPGAWTHGFYDGWAPNYMFWIGMGHNSIGRFYETFGNRWPTTENRIVRSASERTWYRPNPPLPQVRWSLRNNVNLQQSALLIALNDMAKNRERFLENFWTLSKRSVAKAATEGPAAYVFSADEKRQGNLHDLLTVLRKHGVEVHVSDGPFTVERRPSRPSGAGTATTATATAATPSKPTGETPVAPLRFPRGSFIVRMDQPYSRLADALLDVQYVRSDERVYDDTGWTLAYLKNVGFERVVSADVLKVPMRLWDGAEPSIATPNASDIAFAKRRFAQGNNVPRIAVLHTWFRTQDEGWWRLALESVGAKYDYISTQDVAAMANLREKYDVIIFAPVGNASSQDIVNGLPAGPPLPWRTTALTPNLGGIDETDDMRPGLGLSGTQNLTRFVEDGGLLITARDTSVWAVEYGLARYVRIVPAVKLKAPGTIVKAALTDKKSPVVAGYDDTLPMFFAGSPIFKVGVRDEPAERDSRPSGRGGKNDPDVPQGRPYVELPERAKPGPGEEGFQPPEDAPYNFAPFLPRLEDRPRVLVSFAAKADELLMSGMLDGGDEIAGKPAVIAVPRGKGHVLLFAVNPMWRMNTQGNHALVFNAILNWNSLR
jgi:hypothetical protein